MNLKAISLLGVLLSTNLIEGFAFYPCTLIIENNTDETFCVCLEYRLDQLYKRKNSHETPLVPNNKHYHFLNELSPGTKKTIPILAFSPCSKEFCFLDTNLRTLGFMPAEKRIQGAITLQNKNSFYTFTHFIQEGKTLILKIQSKGLTSLFT